MDTLERDGEEMGDKPVLNFFPIRTGLVDLGKDEDK